MQKRLPTDLAVLGAAPAFAEPVHVGRPNIGDRERLHARIDDILDRRWLTNGGPCVEEFERHVAALAGTRHCIAVCNGTIALELAVRALGLTGEVIVPAFTFIATAHALEWQGIRPVFADIDPATHVLDPGSVAARITPRTSGIIGVHMWGRSCDTESLNAVAGQHGLPLLFDAAHALGCTYGGRPAGGGGELEVFSFHATKFVNSLEGGAIVTNRDDLAAKLRLMKNFGFTGYDSVGYIGTNGKMSEFSAAMGLTSLESMERFIGINERNHRTYRDELEGIPGMRLVSWDGNPGLNHQYVVAEVDPACAISRDRLLDVLWAENVRARRYFYPGCHRMEPYRSRAAASDADLPVTERVAARVLVLPTGEALGPEDLRRICGIIRVAVEHGTELMRVLGEGEAAVPADAPV